MKFELIRGIFRVMFFMFLDFLEKGVTFLRFLIFRVIKGPEKTIEPELADVNIFHL